ncbi:hypothetical protein ACU686_05375 [Yinghuangia aomiensis]
MAYFFSYGDKFELHDDVADGEWCRASHRLLQQHRLLPVRQSLLRWRRRRAGDLQPRFRRECRKIRFSVCARNGPSGGRYNCGDWTYATA